MPLTQKEQVGAYRTRQVVQMMGSTADYSSNSMYACADGVVFDIHELNTGRLGGNILKLAHYDKRDEITGVETRYAHLGHIHVESGQAVKRGELLADVAYSGHAKLMMLINGNFVDPDNYGENHSYMNFFLGENEEIVAPIKRHQRQREICNILISCFSTNAGITKQKLFSQTHKKEYHALRGLTLSLWDNIEVFRYSDNLYNARPQLFPGLAPDQFAAYKAEFYANQPIILTLPLKA